MHQLDLPALVGMHEIKRRVSDEFVGEPAQNFCDRVGYKEPSRLEREIKTMCGEEEEE